MCRIATYTKKTGCSTKTLNLVLKTLRPYLMPQFRGPSLVAHVTKRIAQQSGAVVLRLNGCVGCHKHVFGPKCRARLCPNPECQSPRYDTNGKPKEVGYRGPDGARGDPVHQR